MSWYVDSSAILSVIFGEGPGTNLSKVFKNGAITSELSRVEVLRNVTKVDTTLIPRAEKLLEQFDFIMISQGVLRRASEYPQDIRSKTLDAIHLATAETLQPLIDGIVTFDKGMAKDAQYLNLVVY